MKKPPSDTRRWGAITLCASARPHVPTLRMTPILVSIMAQITRIITTLMPVTAQVTAIMASIVCALAQVTPRLMHPRAIALMACLAVLVYLLALRAAISAHPASILVDIAGVMAHLVAVPAHISAGTIGMGGGQYYRATQDKNGGKDQRAG